MLDLQKKFDKALGTRFPGKVQMLVRVGYAEASGDFSPRRNVTDYLHNVSS